MLASVVEPGPLWRAVLLASALVAGQPAAAQDQAASRGQALDRTPYWPGYWVAESSFGTPISGIGARARGEGDSPQAVAPSVGIWAPGIPWNEEGRRRAAAAQAGMGTRKGLGWGYPLMMNASTPVQFLITPEEVLIVNAYDEVRHVYMGREHPALDDLWPTITGNSIGRWDGNALVIDTIMVTNPNEFFQGNPTFSEEARYVERIWLDGETLHDQFTITDPVTLAAPWVVNLTLVRDPGFDRMIQVDWNNDRTDGEGLTIEPPADERESQ